MVLFKKNSSKNQSSKNYLEEKLVLVHRQEEEKRTQALAAKLNLPYLNLTIIPIQTDALQILTENEAKAGQIAVIQKSGSNLKLVLTDPQNPSAQKIIDRFKKQELNVTVFLVSASSFKKVLDIYKKLFQETERITDEISISPERINKLRTELKTVDDIKKSFSSLSNDNATKFLEVMIVGSLNTNASDIHLEKREEQALLRFRLDGELQDIVFLANETYRMILSRIKLLSNMTLNIHDQAQDGRFTISLDKKETEVRVSIIPGAFGENVVMRILNPDNLQLDLEKLGFRPDALKFMQKEIQRPNGMIITTGPTGSGKTTTLYAFLRAVNKPEIKIITLEDPIEYRLEGLTQTQVEAERGYTFASGLRAILRQDPDVILVGEIRDKETAEVALNAALTGHLVFSTLHTNDAAGAIPRFIDMGANPVTLSAGLIDIMAQRLLRRVCSACREEYLPSKEELEKIKRVIDTWPKKLTPPKFGENIKLARGRGCPICNQTGFKGRIAIYEIIPVTPEIEKLITQSPSHAQILEVLEKRQDFISLYRDGFLKVLEGVTTLEELEGVVGQLQI